MPTVNTHSHRLPKGTIRPLAGTKAQKHKSPRIWTPETIKVLTDTEPRLLTETDPKTRHKLLMDAQHILPENLQRTYQSLYVSCVQVKDAYERLMGMKPPAERPPRLTKEQLAANRKARKEAQEQGDKTARHIVKWTIDHLAMLAHDPRIKKMIDNEYPPAVPTLLDAIMKVQTKRLPRDKWRRRAALAQSCYKMPGLLAQLRTGLTRPDPYLDAEPALNPVATVTHAMVAEATQIAADHRLTPTTQGEHIATALGALGAIFKPMLMGLMPLLEQAVAAGVARGLASMPKAETMDPEAISAGVRQTVIDILGPPVPPPNAPVAPAPAKAIVVTPTRPRVDIVGLLGDQETVVRSKCGGQFDLRFIGAKEVERQKITAPVAIMCKKFVSHSAQDRIKKAGANLVYANGGADSVVQQLQQMLQ